MTALVLREVWCDEATVGDYSPNFWRSMARLDKLLTDRGLRPVRIVEAERGTAGGLVYFDIAVECETERETMPFWKWWLAQGVHFTEPARREQVLA